MSALSARDVNSQATTNSSETKATNASGEENMPESQQHKQVLDNKTNGDTNNSNYVSPSDSIMSPASQKLSSFKQRQINKHGSDSTRRSLFARTMSGNSEQSPDFASK